MEPLVRSAPSRHVLRWAADALHHAALHMAGKDVWGSKVDNSHRIPHGVSERKIYKYILSRVVTLWVCRSKHWTMVRERNCWENFCLWLPSCAAFSGVLVSVIKWYEVVKKKKKFHVFLVHLSWACRVLMCSRQGSVIRLFRVKGRARSELKTVYVSVLVTVAFDEPSGLGLLLRQRCARAVNNNNVKSQYNNFRRTYSQIS